MPIRTTARLGRPPRRRRTRIAILSLAIIPLALYSAALGAQDRAPQTPAEPPPAWQIVPPAQSSLVLARDGSLVGEIGSQWRSSVPLSSLPKYLPQAFIAVEDQRFYKHDGVDMVGIAGALKDAVRGNPRGASTITQQLVGNMHPEIIDRSDRSPMRKLREQAAAREMERHYSKDQILEAYLNQVHFGHRWYGVESAARHYFGKSAAQVTLAEAATLAAVINGPAIFDPISRPARARAPEPRALAHGAAGVHLARGSDGGAGGAGHHGEGQRLQRSRAVLHRRGARAG